jgi:hypothetical protein
MDNGRRFVKRVALGLDANRFDKATFLSHEIVLNGILGMSALLVKVGIDFKEPE